MDNLIEEIKTNKKIQGAILLVVLFVMSVFILSQADIKTEKEDPDLANAQSRVSDETLTLQSYFPRKEEPAPIIIEQEIEKEPPRKKLAYDLNQLIRTKKPQSPEPDIHDQIRQELKGMRRKKGKVHVIDNSPVIHTHKNVTVIHDQSRDADFSDHNLSKSKPTFPVDLSRVLTADRFIPIVLYTEIKSDLASEKVLALVESDVYAAHGRKILIPRGSKAIGEYKPLSEQGEERLQVTWSRIITPEGINIKLNAETGDQEGASGVAGEVDNRLYDKYGTALLFSALSAVAHLSVDTNSESQANAAEALTNEFGTVTAESLRNSFDVIPRIRIPKGARLNISVLTDVWFKESENGQTDIIPVNDLTLGGERDHLRFQYENPKHFQYREHIHSRDENLKPQLLSYRDLPDEFQKKNTYEQ